MEFDIGVEQRVEQRGIRQGTALGVRAHWLKESYARRTSSTFSRDIAAPYPRLGVREGKYSALRLPVKIAVRRAHTGQSWKAPGLDWKDPP